MVKRKAGKGKVNSGENAQQIRQEIEHGNANNGGCVNKATSHKVEKGQPEEAKRRKTQSKKVDVEEPRATKATFNEGNQLMEMEVDAEEQNQCFPDLNGDDSDPQTSDEECEDDSALSVNNNSSRVDPRR